MDNIKLTPEDINLGEPIAWNCFDQDGILLLRSGQIIESAKQLETLMKRGLFHHEKPDCIPLPKPIVSTVDLLNEIQQELNKLFIRIAGGTEEKFHHNVLRMCEKIQQACQQDADATIGNIFLNKEYKYIIRHPVNVAVVCEIVSENLKWTKQERLPLLAAALTMNIGMLKTQEILYYQKGKLTDEQKQAIIKHPERGVDILSQSGVVDTVWLKGVAHHHEAMNGGGYPIGIKGNLIPLCAKIISVGDHYCAGVSSRAYRRSLTSQESMKDVYLSAGQKTDPDIVNLCVRSLGVYPPGTIVKLANDEIAVVTHRGEKAHTPIVQCVFKSNKESMFLNPIERDCSKDEFAIREIIGDEQEKMKFDLHLLWGDSKH